MNDTERIKSLIYMFERNLTLAESYPNKDGREQLYKLDNQAMRIIKEALEYQLHNDWIPVSERFPEEYECRDGYIDPSKHVLTQDKSGYYHVSRYWKHRRSVAVVEFPWIDIKDYYEIVAWRPLPEKYEIK